MINTSKGLPSRFSHKPAQTVADFAQTMNMATQAFAVDGANAENVQTTGTAAAVINGIAIASLPVDEELDISADLQFTTWLTATAYTAVDFRYVEDAQGNKQWYKCIASHTSSAATKPGQSDHVNATWRTYWTESSNRAEQASGTVITTAYSEYFVCLASRLGVITLVKAGGQALDAAVELKVPQFDPEYFVCIGHLLIDSAGFTLGTTSTAGVSTFTQWIGPCVPHEDMIDAN